MMANNGDFNPVAFGQMTQEVKQLRQEVEQLTEKVDTLVALVNQGRGVFWVALVLGGAFSWLAHFIASKWSLLQGHVK